MKNPIPFRPILVFTAVYISMCLVYFPDQVFMYPYGLHEWAQADRFALAMKFYDNGMNFFKPATYNLESIEGIVGVEFPIQSYLAAALGHVFGRDSISVCFRVLNICISFAGLMALFATCYKATRDTLISLLVPVFFFCSPIFVFYTCNYLPDTAAVSVSFISFYFFYDYLNNKEAGRLTKAIIFLTLATLMKTSVGVYLLGAMGCTLVLFFARASRKEQMRMVLLFAGSIAIVVSYYLYNRYLNEKYSSELFLAKPYPFQAGEFERYINTEFKEFWIREYFVLPQYLALLAIPAMGVPFLLKDKNGQRLLVAIAIFIAGVVCVALLFGHQFLQHDYYVISIFFPLFAFAMLAAVIAVGKELSSHVVVNAARAFALTCMLVLFAFADYHQYRRVHLSDSRYYSGWKETFSTAWIKDGALILDELGVSRKDKIVTLGEAAPNLAFTYFDRSGYLGDVRHLGAVETLMRQNNIKIAVANTALVDEELNKDALLFKNFNIIRKGPVAVLVLLR